MTIVGAFVNIRYKIIDPSAKIDLLSFFYGFLKMSIRKNFYSTQGWMIEIAEKNKGIDRATLPIFSIIYGFSQTDGQWYTAPKNYIAKMTMTSTMTVFRALKKLEENGLIIKKGYILDNQTFFKYKYNKKLVEEILNEIDNEKKKPAIDQEAEEIETKIDNENNFFDGILENFCLDYRKKSEEKFKYKINNFNLESWKKSLSELIENQGLELVKEHLEWYFEAMGLNKYIPIAKTMPEFCQKFEKMIDGKRRNKLIGDYFHEESFEEKFLKAKKTNPSLTKEFFTRQQFYKGIKEHETPSQYLTRKKMEMEG